MPPHPKDKIRMSITPRTYEAADLLKSIKTAAVNEAPKPKKSKGKGKTNTSVVDHAELKAFEEVTEIVYQNLGAGADINQFKKDLTAIEPAWKGIIRRAGRPLEHFFDRLALSDIMKELVDGSLTDVGPSSANSNTLAPVRTGSDRRRRIMESDSSDEEGRDQGRPVKKIKVIEYLT